MIGKTAKLELFDLQGDLVPPTADLQGNPTPLTSLYNTLLPVPVAGQGEGLPGVLPLRPREEAGLDKATNYKLVAGPLPTRQEL